MKILFTGKSDFQYNRVRVLISGLSKLENIEVDYYPIPKRSQFNKSQFKTKADWADYIYIPPFRHVDVGFIKRHTKTPIVFDPLISKYLTKLDYGHFWKLPIKYFLDLIPFQKADILLTDTQAHKNYFIKKFHLKADKVFHLYIGADTSLFHPEENTKQNSAKFKVGFYGSFVPLQGADKIPEIAYLLKDHKDIEFEVIGGGYTFKKTKKAAEKRQLQNINFIGNLPYEALSTRINSFNICLGIFGDSLKADLVIPNKIYHYASVGKPIITLNSAGIQEIFTHQKNIMLSESSPEAIASSIIKLKENQALGDDLGSNALSLLKEDYNEVKIAESFIEILEQFHKNK